MSLQLNWYFVFPLKLVNQNNIPLKCLSFFKKYWFHHCINTFGTHIVWR